MTLGDCLVEESLQAKLVTCVVLMQTILKSLSFANTANLAGEITNKTVAKCFWKQELIEELDDLGLRESWIFSESKDPGNKFSGTEEDAMEYVEQLRSESLYSHQCSERCQKKGKDICCSTWVIYKHSFWNVDFFINKLLLQYQLMFLFSF